MARFSADGQDYTRALALGTQAALTVSMWFKLAVDRNDYSSIFFIDNGTSDNWGMQTGVDGTTMATVFDASTQQGMGSLTVGVWYYVCLATSGTTGTLYHKKAGDPALTVVAVTSVTASVNAATLRLGESPWGAEWFNGSENAAKVWNRQLTRADAEQDSTQYAPQTTQNLIAYYPLTRPDPLDYSGNGRSLAGSGATYEDGPPIPLQRIVVRPWLLTTPAGGGTVVLGQATETDTATALSRSKTKAIGQSTETDTATAVVRSKSKALGQASEADSSTAFARSKSLTFGQATETDTGTALVRVKTTSITQVTESDTATSLGGSKSRALTQALETDTSTALARSKNLPLSLTSETDTATSLSRSKTRQFGQASETDTAQPVTAQGQHVITLGQASETSTAFTLARSKRLTIGFPQEADTSSTLSRAKTRGIGQASTADTALALTRSKRVTWQQAAETDTAHPMARAKVLTLQRASETDTALALVLADDLPGQHYTVGTVTASWFTSILSGSWSAGLASTSIYSGDAEA